VEGRRLDATLGAAVRQCCKLFHRWGKTTDSFASLVARLSACDHRYNVTGEAKLYHSFLCSWSVDDWPRAPNVIGILKKGKTMQQLF